METTGHASSYSVETQSTEIFRKVCQPTPAFLRYRSASSIFLTIAVLWAEFAPSVRQCHDCPVYADSSSPGRVAFPILVCKYPPHCFFMPRINSSRWQWKRVDWIPTEAQVRFPRRPLHVLSLSVALILPLTSIVPMTSLGGCGWLVLLVTLRRGRVR